MFRLYSAHICCCDLQLEPWTFNIKWFLPLSIGSEHTVFEIPMSICSALIYPAHKDPTIKYLALAPLTVRINSFLPFSIGIMHTLFDKDT